MTTDVDEQVEAIHARKSLVFKADTSSPEKQRATLTPVGTERPRIPDVPEVFLTNESVADVARDLRRQAQVLIDVADALTAHTGDDGSAPFKVKSPQADRLAGKDPAADESFPERMKRLSADAQASAFKPDDSINLVAEAQRIFGADIAPVVGSASPEPGWVCPTHGDADITELKSRKGRTYRACGTCSQFEK